jgi:hypothetical protein
MVRFAHCHEYILTLFIVSPREPHPFQLTSPRWEMLARRSLSHNCSKRLSCVLVITGFKLHKLMLSVRSLTTTTILKYPRSITNQVPSQRSHVLPFSERSEVARLGATGSVSRILPARSDKHGSELTKPSHSRKGNLVGAIGPCGQIGLIEHHHVPPTHTMRVMAPGWAPDILIIAILSYRGREIQPRSTDQAV